MQAYGTEQRDWRNVAEFPRLCSGFHDSSYLSEMSTAAHSGIIISLGVVFGVKDFLNVVELTPFREAP